jgi:glycosyltransferase involved in cell wall biosynthesis
MSVARFIHWKGQAELLDAFLLCAKAIPQLKLCLVGSGVTYEFLLKKAEMSEFKDRIMFTGDRKDALGLLSAADIVSLVYRYPEGKEGDSVGIAGCEALAMGLPLLAGSNLSIIGGLENGKNIQLVVPGNILALSDSLSRLACNPAQRKELGDSGKLFAERNLNWRNIVPVYEQIYFLLKNT